MGICSSKPQTAGNPIGLTIEELIIILDTPTSLRTWKESNPSQQNRLINSYDMYWSNATKEIYKRTENSSFGIGGNVFGLTSSIQGMKIRHVLFRGTALYDTCNSVFQYNPAARRSERFNLSEAADDILLLIHILRSSQNILHGSAEQSNREILERLAENEEDVRIHMTPRTHDNSQ